jgi:hypothetical protein
MIEIVQGEVINIQRCSLQSTLSLNIFNPDSGKCQKEISPWQ